MYQEGRAAWPDVELGLAEFVAVVDTRMGPCDDSAAGRGLRPSRGAELYLACACAAGNAAALYYLEHNFIARIRPALGQFRADEDFVDEVMQRVRQVLLLPGPCGRRAKIHDYDGRGSLRRWLRTVAVRTAIDLRRASARWPAEGQLGHEESDALCATLASTHDPPWHDESERQRNRRAVKQVLEQCLAQCAAKERTLLKYVFVHGLSRQQIGVIYGVHRSTASRWVDGALHRLRAHLCSALGPALGILPVQVNAAVQSVLSQVELTLERVLATGSD